MTNPEGMFQAICEHMEYSYHDGAIRPTITIFRKRQEGKSDLRVWNNLMVSFAGYAVESSAQEGQVLMEGDEKPMKKIGDQNNLAFTRVQS